MNKKLLFLISAVGFKILLDINYTNIITWLFSYTGLVNVGTPQSYFTSWVCFAVVSLSILPIVKSNHTFWGMSAIMLYLFRFIPITTQIAYINADSSYCILQCIFWSLFFVLVNNINSPLRHYSISIQSNEKLIKGLTILMIGVVLFVSGYYAHFRIHLSLDDVYELREEARGFHMPTLLAYLWSPASNVLPLLFIYYLTKKKRWMLLIIGFVILLNFGVAGSKSTLFKLIICLAMTFFYRDKLNDYVGICLCLLCGLSLVEYYSIDSYSLAAIVLRRVFMVPAYLDLCYFDYVQQFGPVYYSKVIAFDIGDIYFGAENMRANNGCFSDAYSQLGMLGLFIYPIIYSLYLRIFSQFIDDTKPQFILFGAFLFANGVMSSAFSTSLLTHGIFLTCLTLALMPKKE